MRDLENAEQIIAEHRFIPRLSVRGIHAVLKPTEISADIGLQSGQLNFAGRQNNRGVRVFAEREQEMLKRQQTVLLVAGIALRSAQGCCEGVRRTE
ncbi:MAG: hypothetical protein AAFQ44_00120 [Pseudomonadota bacterium]